MNTAELIAGALALLLILFPVLTAMVALSRASRRREEQWKKAWKAGAEND